MLEVAADPKHLGAEIGFLSILHASGQNLLLHPHVHCVIPAGELAPDHQRWIHPKYAFFLPVKVLGRVCRRKFIRGFRRAFRLKKLHFSGSDALATPKQFAAFVQKLRRQDWVVYAKAEFGGPGTVLRYLGRYTHRVAISNHPRGRTRLLLCESADGSGGLLRMRSGAPQCNKDAGAYKYKTGFA